MPTFDPDKRPNYLSPDSIAFANNAIDFIRSRTVASIPMSEPNGFRLGNKIRIFVQAHLRRCLAFVDGGLAEYHAQRPLITDTCSRAIYENIAALDDFSQKLSPMVLANDFEKIDLHIRQAAFGTRVERWFAQPDAEKSINILTQLKKLFKDMPERLDNYERLCDIVHPNGLGAAVYFVSIEDEVATIFDAGIDPEKAYVSLVLASSMLLVVQQVVARIDILLPALSEGFDKLRPTT